MSNVIELTNVTKNYGDFVLDNVSIAVPRGGICGFIGQNGAGKTTTIKLIMDIIKADSGNVRVFDEDMSVNGKELKERIGIVYDEMGFHEFMTPKQLDKMFKGIYKNWDSEQFMDYLKRFSLPANKKCGAFSRGMRMKLQIAAAMSHKAELLIMDEPTSGLDPIVRTEFLDIFQEYVMDENNTILFSSHITGDLDRLADEVIFINKGKIIVTGNKDDILSNHGIIKCAEKDIDELDKADVVGIRTSSFCYEVMVRNCEKYTLNMPQLAIDRATLEDILIFYVLGQKNI